MSGFSRERDTNLQQCIYCGKSIIRNLKQCPYCRESQSENPIPSAPRKVHNNSNFRTGLLLMLMSAMVYYFAEGYSPLVLPSDISSPMLAYLVPLLFISGLAMTLWGVFRRVWA